MNKLPPVRNRGENACATLASHIGKILCLCLGGRKVGWGEQTHILCSYLGLYLTLAHRNIQRPTDLGSL